MESPKVFISYAHSDRAFANRLKADLELRGAKVWFDEKEIKVGDSVSTSIEHGLKSAGYFCLVISNSSVARPWVQREYRTALTLQLEASTAALKILPLLIDQVEMPTLLADIRYADFRTEYKQAFRDLCASLSLSVPHAPFLRLVEILAPSTQAGALMHAFYRARKENRIELLSKVWRCIVEDAKSLEQELIERLRVEKISRNEFTLVERVRGRVLVAKDGGSTGILLLPEVVLEDRVGLRGTNMEYNIFMGGVDHLLEILEDAKEHIEKGRLLAVPHRVAWNDAWPRTDHSSGEIDFDFYAKSLTRRRFGER